MASSSNTENTNALIGYYLFHFIGYFFCMIGCAAVRFSHTSTSVTHSTFSSQGQVDSQCTCICVTSPHLLTSKQENVEKREPQHVLCSEDSLDMTFDNSYVFGKRQEVRGCSMFQITN